jgi:hypothetical protein
LSICALVGAHAMVDFSFQMPAVATTFMLLIGAAVGQSLPAAVSVSRRERLREARAQIDDERRRQDRGRRRHGSEPTQRESFAVAEPHRMTNVMDDLRRIAADLEALEAARPPAPKSARPKAKIYELPRPRGDREPT